ncbi:DUF305 domain-containing protein [Streptomyces sp. NPDC059477]|uniref:DUF305 domain-containing protein n=1 Tax=Streptomyces sp. NPDC059477 TaxID=3346847 RepID=UPI0036A48987
MLFRRASRASLTTAATAMVAVLALGACESGSDDEPTSGTATGPSVLLPGEPGDENQTLSAEEAAEQRVEDDAPNSADVSYARMMIEHHTQALEMTELASEQAESEAVKGLAERIAAAQEPEIAAMEAWLTRHGKDGEDDSGSSHDHASMPGMATEGQLESLRSAKGSAFDQLFLTLMITHHEGAITMATDVKGQGNNIQIEEMADDVIAQQTSEIGRMQEMR